MSPLDFLGAYERKAILVSLAKFKQALSWNILLEVCIFRSVKGSQHDFPVVEYDASILRICKIKGF
jgi:hypothetical protein